MQKLLNRGHIALKGFTLIELLVVIAIIGILAGIVLASLGTARGGANDAKIKEQLSGLRTAMEVYYNGTGAGTYGTSATSDGCSATPSAAPWNTTGIVGLADEDNYPTGNALVCYASGGATTADTWAASAQLSTTGQFWCVDSTGASKQTSAAVTAPAAVGDDVTCP
jgi:prepilin-type N-terminal cleavage/methylation domain-containing protein